MHGGSLSCAVVCDQREQASAGILVGDDETCSAQKDKDRTRQASGGLTSLTRTIPPERGPNSQGLASFMKNGMK